MKKIFFLFALLLVFSMLISACSPTAPAVEPIAEESPAEEAPAEPEVNPYADLKVALMTDPIGNEQFILQAYNRVKDLADTYGFQWISIEVGDAAEWEEGARASAAEGYDLVIGVSWMAGEPYSLLADEFPNTQFAVIDTIASNDKVTSIGFNETEGAYVLGVMVGAAFPEEEVYGYIGNFQTQANYKYRWGYVEGVKSINPNATFMYNFTDSYADTSKPYEFALQQQAAGARFIMGSVASGANEGIYQAALDLAAEGTPIYTSGLSVDQTTPDNPYIIGGLLKNTGACAEIIIMQLLDGTLEGGAQILGLKENAFGTVLVTTESANYVNTDIITEEVIAAGKAAAEKIISGELQVVAPLEEEV
jgi:basic membrane protein A and related proteins